MNVTELQSALLKFAAQDMAAARKEKGGCTITNTKQGHIEVIYDREARTYRIATWAEIVDGQVVAGRELYNGPAAGAKLTIANLYQVMN